MSSAQHHAFACMGTVVTLHVVRDAKSAEELRVQAEAIAQATQWFQHIEKCCNRFDPTSEVRQLTNHIGTPCTVSELLLQAVHFALAVAEESDGAFDPTIGQRMEERGFNREYRTGEVTASMLGYSARVSYRDVEVDMPKRSITLHKPLVLDLGAVAKGLAIDLAARELQPLESFEINAGGDVYVSGESPRGGKWHVGIRHPRQPDRFIEVLQLSGSAVCTSGDYERVNEATGAHHIMNAISGETAKDLASVTVVAPSSMVADALATAAFALGPKAGLALVKRHGVQALIVTPSLVKTATGALPVA